MRWLPLLFIGVGVLVVSWTVLIVLARRLPAGLAKDLAGFLPACATTLRRLRRDPRVPRSAKLAVGIAAVWVISPIDLIPEFLPVIGPLDDVVVVVLVLRYAARRVPREAIEQAWPGERRLLDRLLGSPAPLPPASPPDTAEMRDLGHAVERRRLLDRTFDIAVILKGLDGVGSPLKDPGGEDVGVGVVPQPSAGRVGVAVVAFVGAHHALDVEPVLIGVVGGK